MTFLEYCISREIRLKAWQAIAANDFLEAIHIWKHGNGKRFLINLIRDFINIHGDSFELDDSPLGNVS